MSKRQRVRSATYRARRTARKVLAESSRLASVHRSVQQPGSAATVIDGGVTAPASGPEATALQGTSKFEGYDAEGLAIYSNVDLS